MKTEVIKLYEGRDDVTLTTYVLEDSPELLNGGTRPAIIICPGGGYFGCSDREAEPVAIRFASMGYHTFVLRYSTYGEGTMDLPDLSKPLPVKEHCQHPAPMREIGKAMLIVREHAKEWLVDTDRIGICGFSAGAHNCAMYATHWHTPIISEFYQEDIAKFRPAVVILGYTLSDYLLMKEITKNPMDQAFFAASQTAFIGTPEADEETLISISPAFQVTEYMPPTFLWATAGDELVPVQHSMRLAEALANKKIPFEMHVFEEGPHGLALSDQSTAQAKSQVYKDATKWVGLAEAWLEKRFALEIPDISYFEEMMKAQGEM